MAIAIPAVIIPASISALQALLALAAGSYIGRSIFGSALPVPVKPATSAEEPKLCPEGVHFHELTAITLAEIANSGELSEDAKDQLTREIASKAAVTDSAASHGAYQYV